MRPHNGLSRGQLDRLIRLLIIISALLTSAGLLLLLAPVKKPMSPSAVAKVSLHHYSYDALLFPKFSELTSDRHTPFDFEQTELVKVGLRQPQTEPEVEQKQPPPPPAPPPPPRPDIDDLTLVGTVPGSRQSFALIKDNQEDKILILKRGDAIRNTAIKEIYADKIVFELAGQSAELFLTQADGRVTTPAISRPSVAKPTTAPTTYISQQTTQTDNEELNPLDTPLVNAEQQAALPEQDPLEVSGYMIDTKQREELGLEQAGLLITSISRNDIDVRILDVLLAIDSNRITSPKQANAILERTPKKSVDLALFRDGSQITISVDLK